MGKKDRSRSRKREKSSHKKDKHKKKHSRSRSNKRKRSKDHKKIKRSVSRDRWRNVFNIIQDKYSKSPESVEKDQKSKNKQSQKIQNKNIQNDNPKETDDPNVDPMLQLFGFSQFASTKNLFLFQKGQDHTQSSVEAVMKSSKLKRKYRQYMCRRGGFNRILDSV